MRTQEQISEGQIFDVLENIFPSSLKFEKTTPGVFWKPRTFDTCNKIQRPRKKIKCHFCSEIGHIKRTCSKKQNFEN